MWVRDLGWKRGNRECGFGTWVGREGIGNVGLGLGLEERELGMLVRNLGWKRGNRECGFGTWVGRDGVGNVG